MLCPLLKLDWEVKVSQSLDFPLFRYPRKMSVKLSANVARLVSMINLDTYIFSWPFCFGFPLPGEELSKILSGTLNNLGFKCLYLKGGSVPMQRGHGEIAIPN